MTLVMLVSVLLLANLQSHTYHCQLSTMHLSLRTSKAKSMKQQKTQFMLQRRPIKNQVGKSKLTMMEKWHGLHDA